MKVSVLVVACLVAGALSAPSAQVDPALRRVLATKGSANIFISFKEGTSKALSQVAKRHFANRGEKLNGVAAALQNNAERTQKNVLAYLNKVQQSGVKSFWINNKIFIANASAKLVDALVKFSEIQEITEEVIVPLPTTTESNVHHKRPKAAEWGVEKIRAEEAWGMDGGNSGEGIVVSNIDTGVRYTHEALAHNFRGVDYGWYDPYQGRPTPTDPNGHGTHTMGTIAGANGIGVAPGATWIACLGCALFGCSESSLISCAEFVQCPHLPDGSGADCTKAPHLVSNSWGGGQGDDFYAEVVDAWRAADIVPLFSAGNSGPACGSANSPGDDPDVIGVGSTTINDGLSYFSSKGPAIRGHVKPDVSAPGSDIYSSYSDSDTSYRTLSGTSMACPHAAGVAALLKSRDPALSVDDVRRYMIHGNEQEGLTLPGFNCGGIEETTFPNNAFGHGRIDAYNSLVKLIEESGP